MVWKVALVFSDGEVLELDEEFDDPDEAHEAGCEAASNYHQGNDVLRLAGEDYSDDEITRIKVYRA